MHAINVLGIQILFDLAFHAGIPMILDGIVRAAGQAFGNVGPAVARAILLRLEDDTIFFFGPWGLGDGGV